MLASQHMGCSLEIPTSPRFLPACFLSSPFSLLALQSVYPEHHLLPADSGWGNAPHRPLLSLMPVALHFQLVIITLMAHNHNNNHFLKTKGERYSSGSASLQSGGLGRTTLVYLASEKFMGCSGSWVPMDSAAPNPSSWSPSALWLDTQIQRLPGGLSAQPPLVLLSKPQMPLPPPYAYRMGYRENVKMLA